MFIKGRCDDLGQTGDRIRYLSSSLEVLHDPLGSSIVNLGSETLSRHVNIG